MLIIIILGIWAIISIVAHIPGFPARKFAYLYDFGLIPQWNFFAPNPPKGDFILLYRDRLTDLQLGNWSEIRKDVRNKYYGWVWNPNKRVNKTHFDVINELIMILNQLQNTEEEQRNKMIITSIPYLLVANMICRNHLNAMAIERQFAILSKHPAGFDTLFTSNFHTL